MSQRQDYREEQKRIFNDIYTRLNKAQKAAVDTIDGPVMVIAGPGTGKTQILSARIGNILLQTDTQAENILCLTYTDAGVIAMRKRLKSFMGGDAYKVNIYTFHAFCNDIIQANLSYFQKNTLQPVSEVETQEIIRELIDEMSSENILKRLTGDVYYDSSGLLSLFSTMKKEAWTASVVETSVNEYLRQIEESEEGEGLYKLFKYQKDTKNGKKGDYKPAYNSEKERMDKLVAAAGLFNRFQELMASKNRYDFDDMILWVIKAFKEYPDLLSQYQEQYLYILVDEFQDTNGSQNELIAILMGYWMENSNIFVVGDDDQSIYRFQGARMENMADFADGLKQTLTKVVLTENYRSVQPILDMAKSLIENNQDRLVNKLENISKDLISSNEKLKRLAIAPELIAYRSRKEEMAGICLKIEDLIQAGTDPGKIAVIYTKHVYGDELARYLQIKEIPYYSKKTQNLFQTIFGKKLIQLLQYINAEFDTPNGGEEMLFEILHYDWFSIPPIEVARLNLEVASRKYSDHPTSLRHLLFEKANKPSMELFAPVIPAGFKFASTAIELLIGDIANMTLQGLFESLINRTQLIAFIMQSPEKFSLLKILTALFDFIKEETSKNPDLDLKGLINLISLMHAENMTIPIYEINGSESGVNLLTAHGSKGLEFEHVFFAGCISQLWEKKRGRNIGFKLPETLSGNAILHGNRQSESDHLDPKMIALEELRRLFYVAITRAERNLYISYYEKEGAALQEPSQFIAEIQSKQYLEPKKQEVPDVQMQEFQILEFTHHKAPEIEKLESELVDAVLEKFTLNVTALNNFLDCNLSFYFNHVLRIPTAKNEYMPFGTAVHYALEKLFLKMKSNGNKFPEKQEFINDFIFKMNQERENFLEDSFKRRIDYGKEVLSEYYDTHINDWKKIVLVERMIKTVVNGIPIKGKLDKLEFDGKAVNVVDYKTGKFARAKDKLKEPGTSNPLGGDYWRQAVFYKILVDENALFDWQVISTEFDFIEKVDKKEFKNVKIVVSPDDIDIVKGQITESWNKIQNRDFYTGCGKEDCMYCNFVKDNRLYKELHNLDELQEDIVTE